MRAPVRIVMLMFLVFLLTTSFAPAAEEPKKGDVWIDPVTGMEFVWVPGGCFEMGCGSWAGDCNEDEKPLHHVCVDGFWMSRYEVTQGQWYQVMGVDLEAPRKGNIYPVVNTSWLNAIDFSIRLTLMHQNRHAFRLPTEAEWEYACRGGGKYQAYAGSTDVDAIAWNDDNCDTIQPIGVKAPNCLGLYDLCGNVSEWVLDFYDKRGYAHHQPRNPMVTVHQKNDKRIRRGGGWKRDDGSAVRCGTRVSSDIRFQSEDTGFRLVKLP